MRVVVTGAARGIGREVARRLRAEGHQVTGVLRAGGTRPGPDELDDAVAVELAEPSALAEQLADVAARTGGVDGLVHAAGVVRGGDLVRTSPADLSLQFAVNVTAVAEVTNAFLPGLRERGGTVVLVNSGAGLTARHPLGAYATSKFALRAYADALRAEEPGLRVSSIYPGRTDTDMQVEVRALEGGDYRAEEYLRVQTVAAAVITLLTLPDDAQVPDLTLQPWTGRRG